MTAPRRAEEAPPVLERLVREAGKVHPMNQGEREALWRRIEARADASRGVVATPLAVAMCVLAGVLALFVMRDVRAPAPTATVRVPAASSAPGAVASSAVVTAPPREGDVRTLSVQGRGELVLAAHSVATVPASLGAFAHGAAEVRLDSGRIDATVSPRAPDEPFSIVTPQVSVTVVGTAFSVVVDGAVTTITVEHGRVQVKSADGVVFVNGGESVRSDDARLAARRPVATTASGESPRYRGLAPARTPAPRESCKDAEPETERACLSRAASTGGLGGENALLALGLLERDKLRDSAAALSAFRQYERRYPRGALAPEVALALAATLASSGSADAACATATDYERRFPTDAATLGRLRAFCAAASR